MIRTLRYRLIRALAGSHLVILNAHVHWLDMGDVTGLIGNSTIEACNK